MLVPSIPRLHKLGGQLNVLRENHKNINSLYNTRKSLKEYSVDLDETIKAVADLLRECFGTTIAQVRMAKTYSDLAHREVMLKPKPPKHKPMPMPMPKPKPKTKTTWLPANTLLQFHFQHMLLSVKTQDQRLQEYLHH